MPAEGCEAAGLWRMPWPAAKLAAQKIIEYLNMKTVEQIIAQKSRKQPITMLTAYDYPIAYFVDTAGIDIILVGDSLANVVLGLESTTQVGMKEMLHHTQAVVRAVKNAMVVGDMPFESYQVHGRMALDNARQFIDAGCQAVKLEWFEDCPQGGVRHDRCRYCGHGACGPDSANRAKIRRHEGAGQGHGVGPRDYKKCPGYAGGGVF